MRTGILLFSTLSIITAMGYYTLIKVKEAEARKAEVEERDVSLINIKLNYRIEILIDALEECHIQANRTIKITEESQAREIILHQQVNSLLEPNKELTETLDEATEYIRRLNNR